MGQNYSCPIVLCAFAHSAILRDPRARAVLARMNSTQGRDRRHQGPQCAIPLHQEGDLFNDDWETVVSNFKLGVSTLHLPDYIILLLINSSAADAVQNRVAELVLSFFSMSTTS